MTATSLDIRPVGAALGAEIFGVDLNNLEDTERAGIKQALNDHLVIFFPDQNLSPDGHRDFASIFGELEVVPALPKLDDDHPEIVVLDDADTPAADVWHTDVTFTEHPPIGAILHMIECPTVGGDTQWINLYRAYDTLSAPMKEMLEGLSAIHVNRYGTGHVAEHPVVRVHPETGAKSIYVNRIFTSHIPQLSRPESDTLLPFLYRWCEQTRFSVRYRWQKGGVGMWDNRCTLHSAVNDWQGRRIIQRITVLGDTPTGVGPPRWDEHVADANGASDFYGMSYPF
ncbi:MAG: TauD/TfdA family dioxygenase [Acidobacteria bacterium]|nr:TauD/TfdA family dioxygenase [Acidobacteriota bacterium]